MLSERVSRLAFIDTGDWKAASPGYVISRRYGQRDTKQRRTVFVRRVDLRAEPWVLTVPRIEASRYHAYPWDDLWAWC